MSKRASRAELRRLNAQARDTFDLMMQRLNLTLLGLQQIEKLLKDPEQVAIIRRVIAKLQDDYLNTYALRLMFDEKSASLEKKLRTETDVEQTIYKAED